MAMVNEEIKPTGDGARSERQEPGLTPGLFAFVSTIARMSLDGECAECGLVGDDEPYDCKDHELFDMTTDDAFETIHSLITKARELRAALDNEAGANLIAAAPLLYERLKDALQRCKELDVTMCDNYDHADDCDCEGDKGRAALALVDGPQTKDQQS